MEIGSFSLTVVALLVIEGTGIIAQTDTPRECPSYIVFLDFEMKLQFSDHAFFEQNQNGLPVGRRNVWVAYAKPPQGAIRRWNASETIAASF